MLCTNGSGRLFFRAQHFHTTSGIAAVGTNYSANSSSANPVDYNITGQLDTTDQTIYWYDDANHSTGFNMVLAVVTLGGYILGVYVPITGHYEISAHILVHGLAATDQHIHFDCIDYRASQGWPIIFEVDQFIPSGHDRKTMNVHKIKFLQAGTIVTFQIRSDVSSASNDGLYISQVSDNHKHNWFSVRRIDQDEDP
jgi:hypothetical protein